MNEITDSSSMYEKPDRPSWPLNALPKHWVEALFSKMGAFYGDKFSSMWRTANLDEVKKAWGVELFKLSRDQLKAGSDSLASLTRVPTLPEFIAHCKTSRLEHQTVTVPRLGSDEKADPEVVEENMKRIKEACRAAMAGSVIGKGD